VQRHGPWKKIFSVENKNKKWNGRKSRENVKQVPPPPKDLEYSIFYDGSGRSDIPQGGAGAVLYDHGREVAAIGASIPYATNNIGEFSGPILGMRKALQLGWRKVAIVGDCNILTGLMMKSSVCKSRRLEKLRVKNEIMRRKFEEAVYYHTTREFNSRSDGVAYASGMSIEAGQRACANPNWDPRGADKRYLNKGDEILKKEGVWKMIEEGWNRDAIFPIPAGFRPPAMGDEIVNCSWAFFPSMRGPTGSMKKACLVRRIDGVMTKVTTLSRIQPSREDGIATRMKLLGNKIGGGVSFREVGQRGGKDQEKSRESKKRKVERKGEGSWKAGKVGESRKGVGYKMVKVEHITRNDQVWMRSEVLRGRMVGERKWKFIGETGGGPKKRRRISREWGEKEGIVLEPPDGSYPEGTQPRD